MVDTSVLVIGDGDLRLEERDGVWVLAGSAAARFVLVDEYLAHLADRNYSPKTVRAYGYDLLAFCRWLAGEDLQLSGVTTEVLLRFLRACREATVPGRPGPNVVRLSGRRMDRYADGDDDQPSAGGDLWVVRVFRDAGSGGEEPGAEGQGGPLAGAG